MPKKYRLTVADLKAFRPLRRLSSAYFSLAISKASRTGVACVVSKKVSLRAIDRNRVKRRARSALLPFLSRLAPGTYVLYAKKEVLAATSKESSHDIEKLIERL